MGADVGVLLWAAVASTVSGRAEARLPAKPERVAGGRRVCRGRKCVWKAVGVEFHQLNKGRASGGGLGGGGGRGAVGVCSSPSTMNGSVQIRQESKLREAGNEVRAAHRPPR